MKRFLVLFLAVVLLFGIVGCTGGSDVPQTDTQTQQGVESGSTNTDITAGSDTTSDPTTENSTTENEGVWDVTNNYTLLIFGEEVQMNIPLSINVEDEYAELPLITIIKKAGGTVDWVSDSNVKIVFDGKKYVLNPLENSLYEEGSLDNFDFFTLPPGTHHGAYHKLYDREYVVDEDVLRHFLFLHGIRVYTNCQTSVVSVFWINE